MTRQKVRRIAKKEKPVAQPPYDEKRLDEPTTPMADPVAAGRATGEAIANYETVRDLLRDAGIVLAGIKGRLTNTADDIRTTNPRFHPIKFNVKETWMREIEYAIRDAESILVRIPKLYEDHAA